MFESIYTEGQLVLLPPWRVLRLLLGELALEVWVSWAMLLNGGVAASMERETSRCEEAGIARKIFGYIDIESELCRMDVPLSAIFAIDIRTGFVYWGLLDSQVPLSKTTQGFGACLQSHFCATLRYASLPPGWAPRLFDFYPRTSSPTCTAQPRLIPV